MRPILLLVPGWAEDARVFSPLLSALEGYERLEVDPGYFGPPRLPSPQGGPIVALCHSLGLLWLLHQAPFPVDAIVSLGGFARFSGGPDCPEGVSPRLLDRMIARFGHAPEATLRDFRQQAGDVTAWPPSLDSERLRAGLEWLRDWDARSQLGRTPLIALAGEEDRVVTPALARRNFEGIANVRLRLVPGASHALSSTFREPCLWALEDLTGEGFTA